MTLKNSFLISLKENAKRRAWVLVISLLMFFVYFPLTLTVTIVGALKHQELYPEPAFVLEKTYLEFLENNPFLGFLVGVLALVIAMQGFSYLYHKKKVDMYHSTPMKRGKRFGIIYLNGILIFVVSYLVNILLGFGSIAIFGDLSIAAVKAVFAGFGLNLILFLSIYNLAVIAVMMTGNLLVGLMGFGVFLLYEPVVRLIQNALCQTFFKTFVGRSEQWLNDKWLSPIYYYAWIMSDEELIWAAFFKLIVIVIVTGVIAFFLYQKRASEACGKALAFPKTKVFIKLFLVIPIGLIAALFFYQLAFESIAMGVAGLVLGVLFSNSLIEVIYEFDIKAIFRKKRELLGGLVLSLGIFLVFVFDVFGYDVYIPKAEKVASVGVSFRGMNSWNSYRDLKTGRYISTEDYQLEHIKLTDVETVLELAKNGITTSELKKSTARERLSSENDEDRYLWMVIRYNMKNGKTVYRQCMVPYNRPEQSALLDKIYLNKEFKEDAYQIYEEDFGKNMTQGAMFYQNGIDVEGILQEGKEKLIEDYKEDLAKQSFTDMLEELPCGEISISYSVPDKRYGGTYKFEFGYMVYPSFEKTIANLKNLGIQTDYQLLAENIGNIWLNNYREGEDIVLTEKEDIERVLENLYPENLYGYDGLGELLYDYIEAEVEFPDGQRHFRIKKGGLTKEQEERLKVENNY